MWIFEDASISYLFRHIKMSILTKFYAFIKKWTIIAKICRTISTENSIDEMLSV